MTSTKKFEGLSSFDMKRNSENIINTSEKKIPGTRRAAHSSIWSIDEVLVTQRKHNLTIAKDKDKVTNISMIGGEEN
jgi:hypothetical protein